MTENFNFLGKSDIFSHLSNLKYIPRWAVLIVDVLLCVISYYIAHYFSMNLIHELPDDRILSFFQRNLVVIFAQIVFFWIFHT